MFSRIRALAIKPYPGLVLIPVAAASYVAVSFLFLGHSTADASVAQNSPTHDVVRSTAASKAPAAGASYSLPKQLPGSFPALGSVFAIAPPAAPIVASVPAATISGAGSSGGGDYVSNTGSSSSPGNRKSVPTPSIPEASTHAQHSVPSHETSPHAYTNHASTTPRSFAPATPHVAVNPAPQRYAVAPQAAQPRVVVVPRFNFFTSRFFGGGGSHFNFAGGGRHR